MAYIQIPSFTKINVLDNDTEFVIVVDGVEHLVTFKTLSDKFGNTPELLAQIQAEIMALKSIIDALPTENPAAPIALKISDTPIIDGLYKPTEVGTYPNAGGLIYDPTEGITYFIRTGGIWTKDVTPVNFIPTGEVEEGEINAVSGDTVFESLKPLDYAIEETTIIDDITSTGFSGLISYEGSVFTGWGQIVGNPVSFDTIRIPKVKYTLSEYPITQVKILVREDDFSGTIIHQETLSFSAGLNEEKEVISYLTTAYENTLNREIWVEVKVNGRLPRFDSTEELGTSRYTTNPNINTNFASESTLTGDGIGYYIDVGTLAVGYKPTQEFIDDIISEIPASVNPACDIVINKDLYACVGEEFNIYYENSIHSNLPLEMLDIDINCSVGKQMEDKFWYTGIPSAVGSAELYISVSYQGIILAEKTVNIHTASDAETATISLNYVSDSTGNPFTATVMQHLSERQPDVLALTLKGSVGTASNKNEARGGWKLSDYTTAGRTFYKFTVSGVSIVPFLYAVYINNGSSYVVMESNVTAGSGYISCERVGSTLPLASGTLTKTDGIGDDTVNYSAYEVITGNPFWNSGTSQLDFSNYYSNYGITMGSGDWYICHLLINDIFPIESDLGMQSLITDSIQRYKDLFTAIKAGTAGIRIALAITIPPTISQDGFGYSYSTGQTLHRYYRNLYLMQKALIQEFDNSTYTAQNIFVLGLHLGIDRNYNFLKGEYYPNLRNTTDLVINHTNGVHPDDSGYWQMADMIWAFLKNKA